MAEHAAHDPSAYIMHHVQDGHTLELPGPHGIATEYDLAQIFGHWELFGIDFTPTKSVVMMWVAAVLLLVGMLWSMRGRGTVPKGKLQNTVEMLFLFIRDEIAEKNIGHDGRKYVPYLATAFFFILAMNLLGLIPFGATATGSLGVTMALASLTFIVTQVAGMRAQGAVGYWLHLVPAGVPWWLYPLLVPIELIGLFTKPFALTMRLFANMAAGHIVLFFILGLILILKSVAVAPVAVALASGIFLLELFVAFVQAFVFTLLSAVFIGLASHAH